MIRVPRKQTSGKGMNRSIGILAVAVVLGGCSVVLTAQAPAYPLGEEVYDIPRGKMPPPGSCLSGTLESLRASSPHRV